MHMCVVKWFSMRPKSWGIGCWLSQDISFGRQSFKYSSNLKLTKPKRLVHEHADGNFLQRPSEVVRRGTYHQWEDSRKMPNGNLFQIAYVFCEASVCMHMHTQACAHIHTQTTSSECSVSWRWDLWQYQPLLKTSKATQTWIFFIAFADSKNKDCYMQGNYITPHGLPSWDTQKRINSVTVSFCSHIYSRLFLSAVKFWETCVWPSSVLVSEE